MKKILLLRHSEPDKNSTYSNELIPLSENGKTKAEQFFRRLPMDTVTAIYSSPYLRAQDTASFANRQVVLDNRLIERQLGDKTTWNKECWAKQYEDLNFKNKDGESFLEVQQRMNACIGDILQNLKDDQTAITVSHAAAICSYLFRYCKITVIDPEQKSRRIEFKKQEILCGNIETPSAFSLSFNGNDLTDILYLK